MSSAPEARFPWASQPDAAGCDLAFRFLVNNMSLMLANDRGDIHAETVMSAAGAVAGFGAHVSLTADAGAMKRAMNANLVSVVTLKDGRGLMFGDALNDMLTVESPRVSPYRVWNLLKGSALSLGADENRLPTLEEMFGWSSRSLGSNLEGFPDTPQAHQPHVSAYQLLHMVGPFAVKCLVNDVGPEEERPAVAPAMSSWVAITAQAAASYLRQVADVLDPVVSARIAMESAICCSRMPATFLIPAESDIQA